VVPTPIPSCRGRGNSVITRAVIGFMCAPVKLIRLVIIVGLNAIVIILLLKTVARLHCEINERRRRLAVEAKYVRGRVGSRLSCRRGFVAIIGGVGGWFGKRIRNNNAIFLFSALLFRA